ncbi:MAG: glycoside hydrolase family 3 C-terminal domain-containing protein [Myxococcota bacterium]|nr:glycoside hydrolase family 3 C-terminal domain-containing protein [Myxococcota bacterium]
MRRYLRNGSLLTASGLIAFALVGACGHSDEHIAASKGLGQSGPPSNTGNTGNVPSIPGGGMGAGGQTGGEPTSNCPDVPPVALTDTVVQSAPAPGPRNSCGCGNMPPDPTRPGYTAPRDPEVTKLLGTMSLNDKILQMQSLPNPPNRTSAVYRDIERSPDTGPIPGVGNKSVLGYRYRDAGRGVNLAAGQDNRQSDGKDTSTVFPTQSARAASWDVDLEFRIGEAIGEETMTSKNNMLLAPCMNIIRHPYWGRTQETYSEDMFHTGRMASAMTAGIQQRVVACPKHYAANNVENNRANQNAVMTEQTLREVYVKHFEMVVKEGGAGCIMASYNLINGTKATQNQHLLRDLLKLPSAQNGMGYRGVVLTDWWAMPGDQNLPDIQKAQTQAQEAVRAGLDIEVPWNLHFNQLGPLVESGRLTEADINDSAGRVLEQKARFKSLYKEDNRWGIGDSVTALGPGGSIINNQTHLDLAQEAAEKSAVLLTNGVGDGTPPVLPITTQTNIAVIGLEVDVKVTASTQPPPSGTRLRHAYDVNLGDRGSSRVNNDPAQSIGPCDGFTAAAAAKGKTVVCGSSVAEAANADFVVVMVGLTAGDEAEEYALTSRGDRKSLDLPNNQAQFVKDALALGKPTAIIMQSGSIVNVPWTKDPEVTNKNQATVWAGYAGQRQGAAFARLLFGDVNFSGKMPMAWPEQSDLPAFTTAQNETEMGYFFGYRLYDNFKAQGFPINLVFPFGHGLSYSKFDYLGIDVPCGDATKDSVIEVKATVGNSSARDGEEIVMLFVKGPPKGANIKGERAVKELKGFRKVPLKAGEIKTVGIPLKIEDLRHWEPVENKVGELRGQWVVDPGDYTLMVGPSADEAELTLTQTLTVKP